MNIKQRLNKLEQREAAKANGEPPPPWRRALMKTLFLQR